MLIIELNRANYEYDVNSLVRAFYPGENVTILTPETTGQRRQQTQDALRESIEAGKEALRMKMELFAEGAVAEMDGQKFVWSCADTEFDSQYRHGFKRFLYGALRQFTGKTLPWGSLTGIRPTKIAYGMLEQGYTDVEILDTFTGFYEVCDEKAKLGLDIAKRERDILKDVHCGEGNSRGYSQGYSQGYSLYIGIPFCPTTCMYCSFTSYPIAGYRKLVDSYIDCLIREMEYVSNRMAGRIPDSVYIGGGTPTTLDPEQLDRLLGALKDKFDFRTVREFTVEAGRADSITQEKLEVLHDHGVGRISVNPQTMNRKTLDIIGRRVTVEQVVTAYRLAREVGFDNINMDLILGLPGELEADVQRTVDQVVELEPDSLTVHSLAIKRASALSKWIQENGVAMLRNTEETMRIAAEGARRLGMEPYYLYRQKNMSGNFENVGYARPGKYGLYNILIMEEVQTIVALGAGSITKRVYPDGRIERCENVKDVAQYIGRIDEMIERKRKFLSDF